LISALLIPTLGWRSVFYVGGIVPLILAVLMYFRLPESIQLLVLRKRSSQEIGRWLRHIDPHAVGEHIEYVVEEETRGGIPAAHLLRDGRAAVTVLLWVVNFINLLNLYFLWNWVPTVMRGEGYSTVISVLIGSLLQVGGVIGTFSFAWLVSRVGFVPVLTTSFAVCSLSMALIGQPGLPTALLIAGVFAAGWCVSGNQNTINALSASSYPTYLRSTGVGWALGIGRIGAIIGPIIGGELIRRQWSTNHIFLAAAIPALVSAIATFSLRSSVKPASLSAVKTKENLGFRK
jgi:AAHS family 4-hydroxybenzoate transporter-like MFS transporter